MSTTRIIQNKLLHGYGIHPIYSQPIAQHLSDMLSDKNTQLSDVTAFMKAEFNTYPTQTAEFVAKQIMTCGR